jgi:hypothetical protein
MTALEDVSYIMDLAAKDVRQAQTSIAEGADQAAHVLAMAQKDLGRYTVERLTQAETEIKAAADKIAAVLGDVERARGLAQAVAGAT